MYVQVDQTNLHKKHAYNQVIEECTQGLKLDGNHLKLLYRRSQAYEALEKYEEAIEDLKKLLSINPNLEHQKKHLDELTEKYKRIQKEQMDKMLGQLKELGNTILGLL